MGGLVLIAAASLTAGLYTLSRVPLPTARPLQQTTFVYDSSGHVLASFSEQNRVNVSLSQVPPIVVDAVVSTEDRHFFSEGALNPVSIVRAALSDVDRLRQPAGRVHHHPAVRQADLPHLPTEPHPQAQGGGPGYPDLPIGVQEPDPAGTT